MLVQAAGTGASAGAAAVSESDMSVLVLWDVPVLCPVLLLFYGRLRIPVPRSHRETDRQWK